MTCNCGSGDTPEYYITLDGVGVDGYSPEVNVIDETSSSFKIEVINKSNTQTTTDIPKLSYLPTEYLKVDGSNANNPITLNNLQIRNNSGYVTIGKSDLTTLNLQARAFNLVETDSNGDQQSIIQMQNDGDVLVYAGGRLLLRGSEARPSYQQGTGTTYSLARLTDIPTKTSDLTNDSGYITSSDLPTVGNGTITLTQGGVTKGTFTTNQSGNTTIALDSGASNPLIVQNSNSNGFAEIYGQGAYAFDTSSGGEFTTQWTDTVDDVEHTYTRTLYLTNGGRYRTKPYIQYIYKDEVDGSSTSSTTDLGFLSVNGSFAPLSIGSFGGGYKYILNYNTDTLGLDTDNKLTVKEMTGCDSITGGASGLVPAPSAGDEDKFLQGDGTWGTIDVSNFVTNASLSTTLADYATLNTEQTISNKTIQDSSIILGTNDKIRGVVGTYGNERIVFNVGLNVEVGSTGANLYLYGTDTRPYYKDSTTQTTQLALYSDIPTNNNQLTNGAGYITGITSSDVTTALGYTPLQSSDLSGYVTSTDLSTTLADYVLSSSLATVATSGSYNDLSNTPTIPTNADYVDLSTNQTVGGNKTFTGTNYLRTTYLCNTGGTFIGRVRQLDDKLTFEGIGTNRSINFIPNGTGTLQYNGNEVATVNDIPDVSQLQEKLTAGDGINIQYNYIPPIIAGLPITLDSNNNIVKVLDYDEAKDDIVLTFVVTTSTFTGDFVIGYSNSSTETSLGNGIRMGRYNDGSTTQGVYIATMYYGNIGDTLATISASPFNDAGSIYLRIVIHNDSTIDFSYSLDGGETYSTPATVSGYPGSFYEKYVYMSQGSGQSIVTNIMGSTTEAVNLISVDTTTIATKSYVDSIVGDIETLINSL